MARLTYRDGKYLDYCLEARCARWLRVLTLMFDMNSDEVLCIRAGRSRHDNEININIGVICGVDLFGNGE